MQLGRKDFILTFLQRLFVCFCWTNCIRMSPRGDCAVSKNGVNSCVWVCNKSGPPYKSADLEFGLDTAESEQASRALSVHFEP